MGQNCHNKHFKTDFGTSPRGLNASYAHSPLGWYVSIEKKY